MIWRRLFCMIFSLTLHICSVLLLPLSFAKINESLISFNRQEMRFRNKLVEYLTDWCMGNSHQIAPPAAGKQTHLFGTHYLLSTWYRTFRTLGRIRCFIDDFLGAGSNYEISYCLSDNPWTFRLESTKSYRAKERTGKYIFKVSSYV